MNANEGVVNVVNGTNECGAAKAEVVTTSINDTLDALERAQALMDTVLGVPSDRPVDKLDERPLHGAVLVDALERVGDRIGRAYLTVIRQSGLVRDMRGLIGPKDVGL